MMYNYKTREDKVSEFHRAMGLDLNNDPSVSLLELRKNLLLEEVQETVEAIDKITMELMRGKKPSTEDWANFLKELASQT